MEMPEAGSRVLIRATTFDGEVEHEGLLLAPAAQGCITVKLVNGYNVTYPLDTVSTLELIEAASATPGEALDAADEDASLPEVWIIHTGGTIASKVDYVTGAVAARFEPEELLDAVPELANHARIRTVKLGNMWSDDIRPQHWNAMMDAAADAFASGASGVVITHGTDTMHLSASAANFAWAGSGERPPGRIVFTGSQRSSDRGSSDGAENLIAAVHWAAHGPAPSGEQGDAAVIIMHEGTNDGTIAVQPGCAVRKAHSSRRGAFQGVNRDPLARVHIGRGGAARIELASAFDGEVSRPIAAAPVAFNPEVRILNLLAGPHMHADQIELGREYDAILFHGSGLGHLPMEDANDDAPENIAVRDAVAAYCADGGIAVMATQCIHGPVHMDVYSKGRDQQALGILGATSNTGPDAAMVKLHFLLSTGGDVASDWMRDLCGENPESIPN